MGGEQDDREEEVGLWRPGMDMLTTMAASAGPGGDCTAASDGETMAATARGDGIHGSVATRRRARWQQRYCRHGMQGRSMAVLAITSPLIPAMGMGDDAGDGGGEAGMRQRRRAGGDSSLPSSHLIVLRSCRQPGNFIERDELRLRCEITEYDM
uniref:Uncharacterized protein n=1 Tax=Oryza meridionalis TaxID=40149 RepID=A0A0E0E5P0_9ORYZ